jgi:hypothetical protein
MCDINGKMSRGNKSAKAEVFPEMKNGTLKVEYRSLASLIPYKGNARTHSPEQVEKIAASMREFGWTNPVLVDGENGVIAGHGRIMAAKKLGIAEAPCIELAGLSEAQKRAYIIADNKTALDAGWDNEILKIEFEALAALDFDLALTGFSLDEIKALDDSRAGAGQQSGAGSLAEKFMVAPFSVLNAREGWWQDRKRAWLALGIQSELGRGDTAATGGSPEPLARARAGENSLMRAGRKPDAMPVGGGPNSLVRRGYQATAERNARRLADASR